MPKFFKYEHRSLFRERLIASGMTSQSSRTYETAVLSPDRKGHLSAINKWQELMGNLPIPVSFYRVDLHDEPSEPYEQSTTHTNAAPPTVNPIRGELKVDVLLSKIINMPPVRVQKLVSLILKIKELETYGLTEGNTLLLKFILDLKN